MSAAATTAIQVKTNLFAEKIGYELVVGSNIDRASLLKFLRITYQELYPQQEDFRHLESTVDRYLSVDSPLWFVTSSPLDRVDPDSTLPQPKVKIACLWLGMAIDQITGIRHPNIFLIYVDPAHRRQGIARALMQHAETWAKAQQYPQMGLQVFTQNQPAIELYQKLGYRTLSISMMRQL